MAHSPGIARATRNKKEHMTWEVFERERREQESVARVNIAESDAERVQLRRICTELQKETNKKEEARERDRERRSFHFQCGKKAGRPRGANDN